MALTTVAPTSQIRTDFSPYSKSRPLGIALVGGGALGMALREQLSHAGEAHQFSFQAAESRNWREAVSASSIDVVVELLGGTGPALECIQSALQNGKHVVTANAAALAGHWLQLQRMAHTYGVQLRAESAVLGSIPVLSMLSQNLAQAEVTRLVGVLNSPSHAVLNRLAETGDSAEKTVAYVQKMQWASRNPQLDFSGKRTLYQLSMLAQAAFGFTPSWQDCAPQGVTEVDATDLPLIRGLGYVLKPIAIATPRRLRIAPMLVNSQSPIGTLKAPQTMLEIQTKHAGTMYLGGAGGGLAATAVSLAAEIRALQQKQPSLPLPTPRVVTNFPACPPRTYYIRMQYGLPCPNGLEVLERTDDADQLWTGWLVRKACSYGEMEQRYGGLVAALYEKVDV